MYNNKKNPKAPFGKQSKTLPQIRGGGVVEGNEVGDNKII